MNKNIIGLVFTILALVFVIIGLFGSWYTTHMKMTSFTEMESTSDIYLTKMETISKSNGQESKQSMELSEIREQYKSSSMDTSFLDAIGNVFIITIVALIFGILTIIFAAISLAKPVLQIIGGIFAIILFVLMILGPILFMAGFTSFVESQASSFGYSAEVADIGFWFSKSEGGNVMSMGPSYAWYLMIVGAVFALISGIVFFIKQKQKIPNMATMQTQAPPANPPI